MGDLSDNIRLTIRSGPDVAEESLGPARDFRSCIIGRCETANLFLRYRSISRHHCVISRRGDALVVQDLGSSQGTTVDGQPADGLRELEPGQAIALGEEVTIQIAWPLWSEAPARADRTDPAGMRKPQPPAVRDEPQQQVSRTVNPLTPTESPPSSRPARYGRTVDFPLAKPRMVIGRDASCDIPLEGRLMVSRRHATLEMSGGRWLVRDENSSNGTFVNGVRVGRSHALNRDDVLSIGDVHLRFTETKLTSRLGGQGSQVDVQGLGIPGDKGQLVVENVSFTIEPGELVGLLGPSGSGKTRLMHGMCGRAPMAQGRVLYDNRDFLSNFEALKTSIGYVPSWLTLHDSLTVAQGLRFASRLRMSRDASQQEIEANIDRVLNELKMSHCKDRLILKLSDGQRRRVGLAVELLGSAPILYLDEVTTALDVPTHIRFMRQFRELADSGKSLLLISHHLNDFDLCDKWLYLIKGRVAFFGPPSEFRAYFGVRTLEEQLTRDEEAEERESDNGPFRKGDHSRSMAARFQDYRMRRGGLALATPTNPPAAADAALNKDKRLSKLLTQSRLVTSRYVALLASDKANLAIMLGLAPVISVLMLLLNSALQHKVDVARDEYPRWVEGQMPEMLKAVAWMGASHQQSSVMIFMLVMSSIIVGTFMSVREIVKERVRKQSMFLHERFAGLDPLAYLVSKIIPLGFMSALSSIALCAVIRFGVGHGAIDIDFWRLLLVTVLTGWAAVLLGLLISCIANTSEKAFYILAPVLILQLCLGGGLVKVEKTKIEPVSQAFALAYWPYNALTGYVKPFTTTTKDTTDKIDKLIDNPKGEDDAKVTGPSPRKLAGKPWTQSIGLLCAQILLFTLTTLMLLSRRPNMSDPR